eukprot:3014060-Amphidinium_carterae.1
MVRSWTWRYFAPYPKMCYATSHNWSTELSLVSARGPTLALDPARSCCRRPYLQIVAAHMLIFRVSVNRVREVLLQHVPQQALGFVPGREVQDMLHALHSVLRVRR